jgi:hypothetical protein
LGGSEKGNRNGAGGHEGAVFRALTVPLSLQFVRVKRQSHPAIPRGTCSYPQEDGKIGEDASLGERDTDTPAGAPHDVAGAGRLAAVEYQIE